MRPKKVYFPQQNPLPKSEWVPPHFNPTTGMWIPGYWRRPKFRKGIVIGYN